MTNHDCTAVPPLQLSYEQAMTAIFVEGWIFIVLSVTGVRGGLVKYMPKNIAMATSGTYALCMLRCAGRIVLGRVRWACTSLKGVASWRSAASRGALLRLGGLTMGS